MHTSLVFLNTPFLECDKYIQNITSILYKSHGWRKLIMYIWLARHDERERGEGWRSMVGDGTVQFIKLARVMIGSAKVKYIKYDHYRFYWSWQSANSKNIKIKAKDKSSWTQQMIIDIVAVKCLSKTQS